jgi:hypothetical protein
MIALSSRAERSEVEGPREATVKYCRRIPRLRSNDGVYDRHFFTISAFSIMAIPPRSAILPFSVTVLPQYSAS